MSEENVVDETEDLVDPTDPIATALEYAFAHDGELPVESTDDPESPGEHAAVPQELDEPEPDLVPDEPVVSEQDQADIAAYLRQAGLEPDIETAEQLVQLRDWYASLDQDQIGAIEQALTNLHNGPVPEPVDAPAPPQMPELNIPGFDVLDDDERAALASSIQQYVESTVTPIQSELEQHRATQAALTQARIAQEEAEMTSGIEAGIAQFKETHPELSDEELTAIQNRVVRTGTWQTHYIAANENPETATFNAFDQVMLTDPDLRAKFIAAQVASEREQVDEDEERKQNLAALGGGGSPAASDTVTSQDREYDDPLAAAIAEAQRNLV